MVPGVFLNPAKKAAPRNTIEKIERNLALDLKIDFHKFFQYAVFFCFTIRFALLVEDFDSSQHYKPFHFSNESHGLPLVPKQNCE